MGLSTSPTVSSQALSSPNDFQARLEEVAQDIIQANPKEFKGFKVSVEVNYFSPNFGAEAACMDKKGKIVFKAGVFQGSDSLAVKNNGELAAVVSHEFGHCLKNHWKAAVAKASSLGLRGPEDNRNPRALAQYRAFLKDQELEAEKVGGGLLLKAGYSLQDAINLSKRRSTSQYEAKKLEEFGPIPPGADPYQFAPFPSPADRAKVFEDLQKRISYNTQKGRLSGI